MRGYKVGRSIRVYDQYIWYTSKYKKLKYIQKWA